MINRHFTQTASLKRMTAYTTGGVKKVKQVAGTSVAGYLQSGNSLEPQSTEAFGKTYTFYCSYASDVKEGDELTINSVLYRVRQVREFKEGKNTHKEILLVKEL